MLFNFKLKRKIVLGLSPYFAMGCATAVPFDRNADFESTRLEVATESALDDAEASKRIVFQIKKIKEQIPELRTRVEQAEKEIAKQEFRLKRAY